MNAFLSKLLVISICFLLIILSGLWLSRSGKPYPALIFTLHKVITLGTIAYLGVTLYQAGRSVPLQGAQIAAVVIVAACFVAMLATGGLLSVEKPFPAIVHRLHQILPYLTAGSVGVAVYLALFAQAAP